MRAAPPLREPCAPADTARLAEFLKHIYPKLDWAALREAAVRLRLRQLASSGVTARSCSGFSGPGGPAGGGHARHAGIRDLHEGAAPRAAGGARVVQRACMAAFWVSAEHPPSIQVHVEEGALVCPESGHRFPIRRVEPEHARGPVSAQAASLSCSFTFVPTQRGHSEHAAG